MEKPGRNLRNLGEPWEPLRSWTGVGGEAGPVCGPPTDHPGGRGGRGGRLRWANLYRPHRDRLRTAAGAPRRSRTTAKERYEGPPLASRETGRGIPRKSRGVYAVITDFSLQLQRSEKTGTELGRPWSVSAPIPALLDRRGRAHTNWRGMPAAPVPVRAVLAPVPAPLGRGCARASSLKVHATVHPHRDGASAPLRSA